MCDPTVISWPNYIKLIQQWIRNSKSRFDEQFKTRIVQVPLTLQHLVHTTKNPTIQNLDSFSPTNTNPPSPNPPPPLPQSLPRIICATYCPTPPRLGLRCRRQRSLYRAPPPPSPSWPTNGSTGRKLGWGSRCVAHWPPWPPPQRPPVVVLAVTIIICWTRIIRQSLVPVSDWKCTNRWWSRCNAIKVLLEVYLMMMVSTYFFTFVFLNTLPF